jgi:hypothetical protein
MRFLSGTVSHAQSGKNRNRLTFSGIEFLVDGYKVTFSQTNLLDMTS